MEFFIFLIVSVAFKWTMGSKHIDHSYKIHVYSKVHLIKSKKEELNRGYGCAQRKPTSNDGKISPTLSDQTMNEHFIRCSAETPNSESKSFCCCWREMINFGLWDCNSACDKGMSSTKKYIQFCPFNRPKNASFWPFLHYVEWNRKRRRLFSSTSKSKTKSIYYKYASTAQQKLTTKTGTLSRFSKVKKRKRTKTKAMHKKCTVTKVFKMNQNTSRNGLDRRIHTI